MSTRGGAHGDLGRRQEREPGRQREPRQPRGRERQPREGQPRERRPGRRDDGARALWGGYDLLWGEPTAPRSTRRSPLDRTRIVRAAIRIGDADGLAAVSMRRIASDLRTGPMSLYRHVPDKDALVNLMIDEALGEAELPAAPSGNWRDDLRQVVKEMWALTQRHPWYPDAVMERPPLTPHGLAGLEYTLSVLDGYGLSIVDRMAIVGTLSNTVMAVAINAAAEARTRARLQLTEDEIMSSVSVYLGRIIESGKYPRFSELMGWVTSGDDHRDPQYELWAAVELILDGIAARLEAAKP